MRIDAAATGNQPASVTFVDSEDGVKHMLSCLWNMTTDGPSIYVDIEGVNLGRHGSVSILQIYADDIKQTFLVDIVVLGHRAFSTAQDGLSLKDLLQSPTMFKIFFDVRTDSDALFALYGIRLRGIVDLQLMELAARPGGRQFVSSLANCIKNDAPLSDDERAAMELVKKTGLELFSPEHGGSFKVFEKRPLPAEILKYCVQDVTILPRLYNHYAEDLTPKWERMILRESATRVKQSQAVEGFEGGRARARGPVAWAWSCYNLDVR